MKRSCFSFVSLFPAKSIYVHKGERKYVELGCVCIRAVHTVCGPLNIRLKYRGLTAGVRKLSWAHVFFF